MAASLHPDAPFQLHATWGTYPFKHSSTLHDLVCTPDGRGLWTVDDTHASLWDPVRGSVLWSFPLHASPPTTCAITPDGRALLVGHVDGSLSCYDLNNGAGLWKTHAVGQGRHAVPSLSRIAVDPFGRYLATFAPDEIQPVTRLWNLSTGQHELNLEDPWPLFSPDGKHLLLGGSRLLAVEGWREVAHLEAKATSAAAFDRSGGRVLVGQRDGTISLWNLEEKKRVWSTTLPAQHGGQAPPANALFLSPDGVWCYAVGTSEVLRLVLSDGRFWDRSAFEGSWRVAPTPDGTRLFGLGLRKRRLRLFDLTYRAEIRAPYEHEESIASIHAAQDLPLVATAGEEGTVRLWTLQDGYHIRAFPLLSPRAAHLAPDGRSLLLLDTTGASLLDTVTSEKIASFRSYEHKLNRSLTGAVFAPDGAVILWDEDRTLLCWEPSTDKERWRKDAFARAVQPSEDGARLWVTTTRCTLEVWNIFTGEQEANYPIPDRLKTHRQVMLPGEKEALCVRTNAGLTVRAIQGENERIFRGSEGALELLASSPHGSTALVREEHAVSVWDVASGTRVQWIDLAKERDEARCGVFHPDGRGFLVGTARGVVLAFRGG